MRVVVDPGGVGDDGKLGEVGGARFIYAGIVLRDECYGDAAGAVIPWMP